MRNTRIALFGVIAALVAMFAMTAVSSANHRTDVDIRVAKSKPFLHGVLQSRAEGCEAGRYVFVRKARPGPNKFVGDDVSSATGAWSVDVNRTGVYVVKTDGSGGCGGDRHVVQLTP